MTLAVDDEFTSSPTPLKRVLIGLLVAMLLATAALLVRLDRGARGRPAGRGGSAGRGWSTRWCRR